MNNNTAIYTLLVASLAACGAPASSSDVAETETQLAEVAVALAPALADRSFRTKALDIARGRAVIDLVELRGVEMADGQTLDHVFGAAYINEFPRVQLKIPDTPDLLDDNPLVGWTAMNLGGYIEAYDERGSMTLLEDRADLHTPLFEVDHIDVRYKHLGKNGSNAQGR